jgi:hypothetical protein
MGVGTIAPLVLMYAFTQGIWIFRAHETEMWARNDGSSAIREIGNELECAETARIYPDYTQIAGAEQNNGTCARLTVPDLPNPARTVTYYWNAPIAVGNGTTLGNIYSHTGTGTPDPATDNVLARNVTAFEFRRNPNGTVRVGFVLGILGYPRRLFGAIEADRLRFTTSAIPRNP